MKNKFLIGVAAAISAIVSVSAFGSLGVSAAVIDESDAVAFFADDTVSSSDSLPSSYNSNDLGYTTSVKKQSYNDCWAYASLAVFESKLLRSGFSIDNMSENHLNAWATLRSNGTGWVRQYTNDGYGVTALGYLTAWQGGAFESDIGSLDITKIQYGDDVDTTKARFGVTSVRYLSKDEPDEIKREIMENGGVYTSYSHSAKCYTSDKLSYYMPTTYTGSYAGHAIEVVGWDDDYSLNNFQSVNDALPENNGAWLIKNSWGDNNSLGGYFWMSYEDKYVFSTKYLPSYSIGSVQEIDESTKLVQNEIFGATYEFGYVNNDEITYINKFSFEDKYKNLDKVIFESECKNADYTLYYIPTVNDAPTSDTSKWTKLGSGKVDYKGYICADISDFEIPDESGAIAVSIDTSDINKNLSYTDSAYTVNSIGVGEWLVSGGTSEYKFINNSKQGQSYIYYNGVMTDLMDWYKINNNDELGGTFVIKAVTNDSLLGDVNLDGKISITDASLIQKYLAESVTLNDKQKSNADVDKNGKVSIIDAGLIQKYLAEMQPLG